jgi:hypothetical protein
VVLSLEAGALRAMKLKCLSLRLLGLSSSWVEELPGCLETLDSRGLLGLWPAIMVWKGKGVMESREMESKQF